MMIEFFPKIMQKDGVYIASECPESIAGIYLLRNGRKT